MAGLSEDPLQGEDYKSMPPPKRAVRGAKLRTALKNAGQKFTNGSLGANLTNRTNNILRGIQLPQVKTEVSVGKNVFTLVVIALIAVAAIFGFKKSRKKRR